MRFFNWTFTGASLTLTLLSACSILVNQQGDSALCDPSVGMIKPLEICSPGNPCTHLLGTYATKVPPITVINDPGSAPTCQTGQKGISLGRPVYNDGAPLAWVDRDGVTRYRCEYKPPGTSSASKRPVVIYFHGSGGGTEDVYNLTSLRTKAINYNLSGDGSRLGFILVAVQGRNLHWPVLSHNQDGTKFDTYHRDYSTNRDVEFVDHIVDKLIADGLADPARIYVSGWSNGGRMASFYGIRRHNYSTSGGNRIAAIANYSSGDPYEDIDHGQFPSCKANPYPTSTVPLYLVSRSCDAIACDQAQADKLGAEDGKPLPPGNIASVWINSLSTITTSQTWQLINDNGSKVNACALQSFCSLTRSLINHINWPDGINDGSGQDLEPDLLTHLKNNPL